MKIQVEELKISKRTRWIVGIDGIRNESVLGIFFNGISSFDFGFWQLTFKFWFGFQFSNC